MYRYIIKLAHGFVLVPTILAFKNQKIFNLLKKPKSIKQLLKLTKLNSGYLIAGLNLLSIFSVITRKANVHYKKTPFSNDYKQKIHFFTNKILKELFDKKNQKIFKHFSKKLIHGWS